MPLVMVLGRGKSWGQGEAALEQALEAKMSALQQGTQASEVREAKTQRSGR